MTNEEIQRVMEFIIKQQESFAESMGQIRESHVKAEERISKLETAAVHLYTATIELNKAHKELATKMAELAEAQTHTDQRVNVLIDIIEKGRNGKTES
jgi:hypothetical protein